MEWEESREGKLWLICKINVILKNYRKQAYHFVSILYSLSYCNDYIKMERCNRIKGKNKPPLSLDFVFQLRTETLKLLSNFCFVVFICFGLI